MRARDPTTPRPRVVLPDEPVPRAAEMMRDHDVGAVPAVDGRESMVRVGGIADRDLAIRHGAAAHHHASPVRERATSDSLVTVRPGADVDEVMKKMRRCKVRRVMVTDGDGVLAGGVAQAGLVREEGGDPSRRVEKVLEAISEPVGLPW